MTTSERLINLKKTLPQHVSLVAVSKTKPINQIQEVYDAGQRIFGENKIQEMVEKHTLLPKDISWHMIGHVQRNKVKYIAHFVNLIHAVDSFKLLQEINKQALKNNRIINCLLQIKIASEEAKFGMMQEEAISLLASEEFKLLKNIKIIGLMGMATFTSDKEIIEYEFKSLKNFFDSLKTKYSNFNTLSMGMSGDYKIAIVHGSTMIRVGSALFGARNY